jgi:HEPN domain-containing protein/predicted nucleotidyltransferase
MIKASPLADPLLEDITRTLVDGFHPSLVVLFGSRARGDSRDDSDYDLLLELDTDREYYELWRAVHGSLDRFRAVQVDVKIRRLGEFARRRDDPGTVDYDVAREGLILYPPDKRGPVRPRVGRVREPGPTPPDSVAGWLERADADLRAIDHLLQGEPPVWMAVAFHAQQAAEKYLKALIISKWRKPPRFHELAPLVDLARALGLALPDLAEACKSLEPYAVDARYPEQQPIPNETDGRAAVAAANAIVAAVRPLLRSY